jgi:putative ABC transport system permease protein
MKVTLIGVTVGIAGAFSLATVLSSVFVDIGTLAWLPTLGAALLLLLVALAACYPPAVRATRVAPAVALRDE